MQQVRRAGRTACTTGIVAGLLLLAAAGCTTSGQPEAIADPRAGSTTTAGTTPSTDDADDVVWQELTRGGFVPVLDATRQVPAVTIYRDGRIFTAVQDPEGRAGPPVALEQAQVPRAALDAFLADAAGSGLFDPGTDFGSPGVTDQPTTTVLLRTDGTPRQVDVYALFFGDDLAVGDVTAAQAERRADLRDLLARAAKLGKDAEPYVPERVSATRFDPAATGTPPAASPAWPGPPLDAFAPLDRTTGRSCLVIEGGEAATVYQADQENAEATWDVDGEVVPILIVPLLPGQEGCPPS